MIWRKLAAYAAIILLLCGAALCLQAIRAERESARRREAGAENAGRPLSTDDLVEVLTLRLELDIVADLAESESAAAFCNDRSERHNVLTAAASYRESDLRQAEKRVGRDRETIVRAALENILSADLPDAARADRTAARIWTAQRLLRARGLYLSPPSGKMGEDTAYAVKSYQIQRGAPLTGEIDDVLVERLKDDYLYGKRGVEIGLHGSGE